MASKPADHPARNWEKGTAIIPNAPITSCPIATSLGLLGKKWTLLVLRDIAMRDMGRFSQLIKAIPGITPRMLSARLKELEGQGMIVKTATRRSAKAVRWKPTEKGWTHFPFCSATPPLDQNGLRHRSSMMGNLER